MSAAFNVNSAIEPTDGDTMKNYIVQNRSGSNREDVKSRLQCQQ